ncbi:unnamed protein product [Cuscuta epithymum]|uniref:WEB family protein n=2 Tax=Cuscuta epithymum TaxID=186058 RepID=A0AAV0C4F2_9ASTE|nr:unnamed protein product [Cuscuta epithymum]
MVRTESEIDTSAPFRSVKEAVLLFGDTLLARQVNANTNLHLRRQKQDGYNRDPQTLISSIEAELEETKQSLRKAREESLVMVTCLSSLQEELQRAKTELQNLKHCQDTKEPQQESEVDEDLKFIEDTTKLRPVEITSHDTILEFQNKRYVSFSHRHHVMAPPSADDIVLERHPSLKTKKKKPLIPLMAIKGFFSRKRAK